MANLLALDQASYTTGYTVLQNGKIIVVGHFDCTGEDFGNRLTQLRQNIISLIKTYDINEVVFEDIQLQDINGNKETGIKTFKMLAEVRGVVHELLSSLKIKYSDAQPIKWKAYHKIAGKGRTQEKKMAQEHALKEYNIKCTEDEADSLCIAIYHYNSTAKNFDWS